mgnify:CR=1 FL=1
MSSKKPNPAVKRYSLEATLLAVIRVRAPAATRFHVSGCLLWVVLRRSPAGHKQTFNLINNYAFIKITQTEKNVPRAIEIDEYGRTILTNGIAFEPLPGRIEISNLFVGDVLIWYLPDKSKLSSLIREFSGGIFSHVGIYSGRNQSIDAGPEGVFESNLLIPKGAYIHVFRLKTLLPQEENIVIDKSREFIGFSYAKFDAITLPARRMSYHLNLFPYKTRFNIFRWRRWIGFFGKILIILRKKNPPRNKIFCSQIIAEAYGAIQYIPKELVESGVFTPVDLAVNGFARHVGWIANTDNPKWHPFDPYSPEPVINRKWKFSIKRILTGHSSGGK